MVNDKYFLDVALRTAEESNCTELKVGVVLVKDKRICSVGYNGTAAGYINCDEALDKGLYEKENHHDWSKDNEIHAELNCLLFAAKYGISTKDCILYVSYEPCDNCLKHIIQAGIKEVVYLYPYKKKYCHSIYRDNNLVNIRQFVE